MFLDYEWNYNISTIFSLNTLILYVIILQNELKESVTCTCLRIPFPPVPSSTTFPVHSLMGARPGQSLEKSNNSQTNSGSQLEGSSESTHSSSS